MFFNKKIKGKVVECSIRNEYTLSQAYMEYIEKESMIMNIIIFTI